MLPLVQTGGGAGLPTGSGNQVLATPANGSSGQAALRALVAADLPNGGTGGAAYGGNTASGNGNVVAIAQAVTINQGDCVVVFINDAGVVVANAVCADDGGNRYTAPIKPLVGTGNVCMFVAFNCRPATQVTVILPGTAVTQVALSVATYTGIKKLGATTNNTQGAVTAGSISLTPTVANSFMVAGFSWFKSGTAITVSAATGNLRTSQASSAAVTLTGSALVDNTQAGLGAETCAVTASVAPTGWTNVAIELIPN